VLLLAISGSAGGGSSQEERFGLIEWTHYAYGVLRAADVARYFGLDAVTVCEFGVASGARRVYLQAVEMKIATFAAELQMVHAVQRHCAYTFAPEAGCTGRSAADDMTLNLVHPV
jgi:hypothetical protein